MDFLLDHARPIVDCWVTGLTPGIMKSLSKLIGLHACPSLDCTVYLIFKNLIRSVWVQHKFYWIRICELS
jgi:hypothetical protein